MWPKEVRKKGPTEKKIGQTRCMYIVYIKKSSRIANLGWASSGDESFSNGAQGDNSHFHFPEPVVGFNKLKGYWPNLFIWGMLSVIL